jgi:hypothetical protein
MASLSREDRRELERVVIKARQVAETGARKALESLAVHHHEPWPSMSTQSRKLRNRLRAHGRQLGDRLDQHRGTQGIDHLVQECAYEHWHRMLFARFLAESDLLIEPYSGVAISLDECRELSMQQGKDWLALGTEFAVQMLPQIFRIGDPVLEVALSPEIRHELETLLKSLHTSVFVADDSLGWVYQFWQTEKKNEVNRSEKKIGADELPAVTELFTDDYMVQFLLHNTLGAWWTAKRKQEGKDWKLPAYEWTYLRLKEGGMPASGPFDEWPDAAKDLRLLDPCMGSGHFLVFALPILVAFRMLEEGLSRTRAFECVLRENLFGLEIDPRCTQIAAFNLALFTWRSCGYQALPPLNIACSGLGINAKEEDWLRVADNNDRLRDGIQMLYHLFQNAPVLGSLINPRQLGGNLLVADFEELRPLLERLLQREEAEDFHELVLTAHGVAKAAEILTREFNLIVTNVPYLGRPKQSQALMDYCDHAHPKAKADLATCFVERCRDFCFPGGTTALVTPQNWLFLGSYRRLREACLRNSKWTGLARLGPRAFEAISGEVVNVILLIQTQEKPNNESLIFGLDVTADQSPAEKNRGLQSRPFEYVSQVMQLQNPDCRITLDIQQSNVRLLKDFAECYQGVRTGDRDRFVFSFWEVNDFNGTWEPYRNTSKSDNPSDGITEVLRWEAGNGSLHAYAKETRDKLHDMHESGNLAWGKRGVAINQMNNLRASLFFGEKFDGNVNVIFPQKAEHLPALWAFCSSPQYQKEVRRLDQKLAVTNATLIKVPFDLTHWQTLSTEQYPNGLPEPFSSDPSQWLFDGHPKHSSEPLQVAVARLLGFRWPLQMGLSFPDIPAFVNDGLERFADADGIMCLDALHGELPAADRVRSLLAYSFAEEWSPSTQNEMLRRVESTSIEEWLRDKFFEQHCILFHQRPFIWHVSDGLKNGFHALINYQKLVAQGDEGHRLLEKLIYSYIGEWIERQRADQRRGLEGADLRVAAAAHLKKELENILNGEPPYDIFVRWKPLDKQPIGWEPDINDGVRINIRPFMMARPLNAKGKNASILRVTPNIKWDKDRGKEPVRDKEDFPWFWSWDEQSTDFPGGNVFDGNRWNSLHYTRAIKVQARRKKDDL